MYGDGFGKEVCEKYYLEETPLLTTSGGTDVLFRVRRFGLLVPNQ